MKLHERRRAPGGWSVSVEVENAYTNGASRFDEVFVSDQAIAGKSREEVLQAVLDSLDDPFGGLRGADLSAAPTQTKAVLEARMVALYAVWVRWRDTRAEAQSRALAAPIITALQNREDAAWAAYASAINQWRLAP